MDLVMADGLHPVAAGYKNLGTEIKEGNGINRQGRHNTYNIILQIK